ncbi:N-6 DNA methylase [Vibrio vulnificus]|uniref:N-6 DNA methylase n=1 Tax=Vibrio vulnificus TaxID=672 RepID=UPI0009BA5EEE|nr:N-6 DNA methylase [Vibrio vulnificus]EHU9451663.1 N-6 DNA methylase [Vibrio vulnificus]EHV2839384.1 N-6 DNA methylase [Vibrio vulnificus]EIA1773151.1 N-6 DNA methylase [Vibrio vulnificus]EIA1774965.1 N-6 DNA methylase [Vibrio vulnificus]EIO3907085.1 N-6 DNA methylase [Vibrio vulnificus]
MNTLKSHNAAMRKLLLSSDRAELQSLVDLDDIDSVLRELLTIEEMREAGSFFTGQELATAAVNLLPAITSRSVVLDPTCGAGNLLIEASRQLGVKSTLSETLLVWGQVLHGFDLHLHFVEATRLRIVIEALNRGVEQDCDLDEAFELLPHIYVRDALDIIEQDLEHVTHVLMNPPFTIWPSPKENYWKEGKVNAAGIVFDKYLRVLPEHSYISAILPDVLRSGSRYNEFRQFTSASMQAEIKIWGRFNNKTDVDVFLLSGVVGENYQAAVWHNAENAESTIADLFSVRTGPLVAYRDPEEGPEYPYFYPKICPQWKLVREATEKRRFTGKALKPPFVVIKRTSSPSDKHRASATLINLKEPVAIENHMIVVTPKDGKLDTCKKLMKVLQNPQTNNFLNERIRLRHLTVGVVKDIPFTEA